MLRGVAEVSPVLPLLLIGAALAAPEMIPEDVFKAMSAPRAGDISTLSLPLDGGGTFTLGDHRGKKVLLSFWASWCAPCRRELPALSEWAKAHPDVAIVAVNVDREQGDARKFLDAVHFDLPVAYDPNAEHLGQYGVTSMPTMFLFDAKGALLWRHTGYSPEKGFTELDEAVGGAR